MPDDITQRVIQVIAKTQHMPADQIKPESTFEELKIDSLDGINIVFNLENEFDVTIPDEAAKTIRGVPDVVEGIQKLLDEKAASA
jgi:acyl carrier protein